MNDRLPVSVLLLARDETRRLERLLPALSFASEVVVVWDPRGDPAARALAERLGARVHEREFDGFGAQRTFALAHCSEPCVLWVDADEFPDQELVAALRAWIASPAATGGSAGFSLTRRTWFLGRRIRHCGWGDEHLVRGGRREKLTFDDAPVHERLIVNGTVAPLAGTLEHHSYEEFADCVDKMKRYAHAGAEQAWRDGRRAGALDVLVRPPLRFLRQYVLQLGFLDGAHGLVLCGFAAAQVFLKYAELWDRARLGRGARP